MSSIAAGTTSTTGLVYTSDSTGNLVLKTNGTTTAVIVDTAQNVGVGVTPSAWDTGHSVKAIQNPAGAVWNYSNTNVYLSQGFYWNGSARIYSNSSIPVGEYNIGSGAHYWTIAPSGTAGGTVSPTSAMTLDNSGNLFVGATALGSNANYFAFSPGNEFADFGHVSGTASGVQFTRFLYNGSSIGSITQSGTGNIALNGTSDRRLKSNIAQITTAQSGPIIDALKPSSFTWIADNTSDVGFIADEMQAVIPNAVLGQPNAVDAEGHPIYQQVNMTNQELIAYLVAEIQSLRARLKAANIA